jgi:hypothetical protein
LSSSWWCSSWSVSVGTFFLDLFCGGIVSCFSTETNGRRQCWGSENQKGSTNTRVSKEGIQFTKDGETKNLWKSALATKVVNPFTRALAFPFIGKRRDFYIPRIPSNLRNIPSVNTYTNVFYIPWFTGLISYIYKSTTGSLFKPGLLMWCLWLGSFLTLESLIHENHHSLWLPNQYFTRFPNSADFWFQNFADSWFQNFADSWLPELLRFRPSWNRQQIRA